MGTPPWPPPPLRRCLMPRLRAVPPTVLTQRTSLSRRVSQRELQEAVPSHRHSLNFTVPLV